MSSAPPAWALLPAARDAAAQQRHGFLLRLARTAAGLTLSQAGQLTGYSAATLSRLERGMLLAGRHIKNETAAELIEAAFALGAGRVSGGRW